MAEEKKKDLGPMISTEQNSPIADKDEIDDNTISNEVCWFNSRQFAEGDEILSEGQKFRCKKGRWVKI